MNTNNMNNNDKNFIAQKIRTQYTEREVTELDELKALDAKVKRPANIFSYIFGSVGAIVMGSGMSLIMTDIAEKLSLGDMTVPGMIIGAVGLAMALVNYQIYKKLLASRKKKYSDRIIKLSDEIMSK